MCNNYHDLFYIALPVCWVGFPAGYNIVIRSLTSHLFPECTDLTHIFHEIRIIEKTYSQLQKVAELPYNREQSEKQLPQLYLRGLNWSYLVSGNAPRSGSSLANPCL